MWEDNDLEKRQKFGIVDRKPLILHLFIILDFGHTPLQRRQVTDNTRAFLLDKFYSFC
jgi:hypothetical protein